MDLLKQNGFTRDHNNFVLLVISAVVLGMCSNCVISTQHISKTQKDNGTDLTPKEFYNANPDFMYHYDGNTFEGRNYTLLACLTSIVSMVGISLGIILTKTNRDLVESIKNFEPAVLFILSLILVSLLCVNVIPGTSLDDESHVYNVQSYYSFTIIAVASIILGMVISQFFRGGVGVFAPNKIFLILMFFSVILIGVTLKVGTDSANIDPNSSNRLSRKFNSTEITLLVLSMCLIGLALVLGVLSVKLDRKPLIITKSPKRRR